MRTLLVVTVALLISSTNAAACPSDLSTLTYPGPVTLVVCPDGDGETLLDILHVVTLTVVDELGNLVVGLEPSEMVLTEPWGVEPQLFYCDTVGRDGFRADATTDASGITHFSGTIAAGGWSDAGLTAKLHCGNLPVVAETPGLPLEIRITSPDLTGDGVVDLFDFEVFGTAWGSSTWYCDFTSDGVVSLADFAEFGQHYGHGCP